MTTEHNISQLAAQTAYAKCQSELKMSEIRRLKAHILKVQSETRNIEEEIDKTNEKRNHYKDKQKHAKADRERQILSNEILRQSSLDSGEQINNLESKIRDMERECNAIVKKYKGKWVQFRKCLNDLPEVTELNKIHLECEQINKDMNRHLLKAEKIRKELNTTTLKKENESKKKILDVVKHLMVAKHLEELPARIEEITEKLKSMQKESSSFSARNFSTMIPTNQNTFNINEAENLFTFKSPWPSTSESSFATNHKTSKIQSVSDTNNGHKIQDNGHKKNESTNYSGLRNNIDISRNENRAYTEDDLKSGLPSTRVNSNRKNTPPPKEVSMNFRESNAKKIASTPRPNKTNKNKPGCSNKEQINIPKQFIQKPNNIPHRLNEPRTEFDQSSQNKNNSTSNQSNSQTESNQIIHQPKQNAEPNLIMHQNQDTYAKSQCKNYPDEGQQMVESEDNIQRIPSQNSKLNNAIKRNPTSNGSPSSSKRCKEQYKEYKKIDSSINQENFQLQSDMLLSSMNEKYNTPNETDMQEEENMQNLVDTAEKSKYFHDEAPGSVLSVYNEEEAFSPDNYSVDYSITSNAYASDFNDMSYSSEQIETYDDNMSVDDSSNIYGEESANDAPYFNFNDGPEPQDNMFNSFF